MWEASWASNVYYIPQILLTILWVVLFIFIQIPAGMMELLFWWLMNPWWDLIMLTFFAIANALWQNCGMCTLCLLYTSPSPRDATLSRMPSSA